MTLTMFDDPVQWVHSHPEMYFRTGKPGALDLAQWVLSDAALSGCRDVMVHHDGDVWAIAGSANWLSEAALAPPDLFVRVVPLASGGPNSMRSEILLNAFCTEVVAVVAGAVVFDKAANTARPALESIFQRWAGLEAGIAFRL